MSIISAVVAYCRVNRVIGNRNSLPWPHLSNDMHRFSRLTTNHAIIMGRQTFLSDELNGQPLPHRRTIVLSTSTTWVPPPGVLHASDWHEALLLAHSGFGAAGYTNGAHTVAIPTAPRHVFVVGGESVYKLALRNGCQWVFATEIEGHMQGDTFFPQLPQHQWYRVHPDDCPKHWASPTPVHEHGISYSFVTYRKRLPI
ncbi:unnamed protein product [Agarophyton chilense]